MPARLGYFVANRYEGCPHNHKTLKAARKCGRNFPGNQGFNICYCSEPAGKAVRIEPIKYNSGKGK